MQYGSLSASQITSYESKVLANIRNPTYVIWIEGFGDTTEYIKQFVTTRRIENFFLLVHSIPSALLIARNEDNYFYDYETKIKNKAKIKIWAGFDDLNIPIFTGVVDSVKPTSGTDEVSITCRDYMGLFYNRMVLGHQGTNNTAKKMLDAFCSDIGVTSSVSSSEEYTTTYTYPTFESIRMFRAVEKIAQSYASIAYFDENGSLNLVQREYSDNIDFDFNDDNTIHSKLFRTSDLINYVTIEFHEEFFHRAYNQPSIDQYGRSDKEMRNFLFNSVLVSSYTFGSTSETLDHDLEGFKFTSDASATIIDTVQVRMKQSSASGYIYAKIYSDSGGSPSTLLGTSLAVPSAGLQVVHTWQSFHFENGISIVPLTAYWCIIDQTGITGTVYFQRSSSTATSEYTYYSAGWTTENNKKIMHRIRGSSVANKFSRDVINFAKEKKDIIKIVSPGLPHLQLFDEPNLNLDTMKLYGRAVIEEIEHSSANNCLTSTFLLRRR